MMAKIIFLSFILLSTILLQQNNIFVSQTQNSSPEVRPFTDLTFEIDVPRQTLLPLQPIPIILKQSNKTSQPILGYKSIGLSKMPVYLYVQKIGSNKRTMIDQFTPMRKFSAYKNTAIAPGISCEGKDWITLGLNIDLPEPGTYELQAVLENADGSQLIESNKITIEIKEPIGIDQEVYNIIKNGPSKEYLFSGGEFDKVKPTLETIKARFPNSVYAKSAFYVLGEKYLVRKQYGQALSNFIRLENDKDFIFAEKVKNYIAEIRRLQKEEQ
jgi:hypothetical protein